MAQQEMTPMEAARALSRALEQSDEYLKYAQLKEAVMQNETNRALIKEYQALQTQLQMAAMAGKDTSDAEVQRFQQIGSLLYMNTETSQYLMAQLRLQKLVGDVFGEVAKGSGLELDFPGM